jgi:hypothetical protein
MTNPDSLPYLIACVDLLLQLLNKCMFWSGKLTGDYKELKEAYSEFINLIETKGLMDVLEGL